MIDQRLRCYFPGSLPHWDHRLPVGVECSIRVSTVCLFVSLIGNTYTVRMKEGLVAVSSTKWLPYLVGALRRRRCALIRLKNPRDC